MVDLKFLERWREYYQKRMNEETPREGRNEQQTEVKDDITEITSAEMEMALGNMKNGKATYLINYLLKCGRVWEEQE